MNAALFIFNVTFTVCTLGLGGFGAQKSIVLSNQKTTVEFCSSARLSPIRCYRAFFFFAINIECISNCVSDVLYSTLKISISSNFVLMSCAFKSFEL